jgi:hypothetical protein
MTRKPAMEGPSEIRRFRLARHVYASLDPEGAVLLDVERDAYIGLNADQVSALSSLVEGWPSSSQPKAPEPDQALIFAELLHSRGLLVHADAGGKSYEALSVTCADEELVPWDGATSDSIRASHVWHLALSICSIAIRLRRQPFVALVERHRQRRAAALCRPFEEQSVQALISAFLNLRVWMYRRRGRCLFDTLVLLDFLARYGVFPAWIIGVRSVPFSAHSWAQHEQAVLNGTPEFVRDYTPILFV